MPICFPGSLTEYIYKHLCICTTKILTYFSGPFSFLKQFSYKDIKRATDSFHRIIDNSSHGAAYKAKFQSGTIALVKEVGVFNEEDDAFYREVQLLGRLHHRHIVALCGFSEGRKRFEIYFGFTVVRTLLSREYIMRNCRYKGLLRGSED